MKKKTGVVVHEVSSPGRVREARIAELEARTRAWHDLSRLIDLCYNGMRELFQAERKKREGK